MVSLTALRHMLDANDFLLVRDHTLYVAQLKIDVTAESPRLWTEIGHVVPRPQILTVQVELHSCSDSTVALVLLDGRTVGPSLLFGHETCGEWTTYEDHELDPALLVLRKEFMDRVAREVKRKLV